MTALLIAVIAVWGLLVISALKGICDRIDRVGNLLDRRLPERKP